MPVRLAAVLALLLAACAREPRVAPPPMLETAAPTPFACPVTSPVAAETIPEAAAAPILDGSSARLESWFRDSLSMYGNEAIWVVIPRTGRTNLGGVKIPTVWLVEGEVTGEARRLDGPAPHTQAAGLAGYGPIGFQSFAVDLPVAGCWEITQRLAGHELRFILEARYAGRVSGIEASRSAALAGGALRTRVGAGG